MKQEMCRIENWVQIKIEKVQENDVCPQFENFSWEKTLCSKGIKRRETALHLFSNNLTLAVQKLPSL